MSARSERAARERATDEVLDALASGATAAGPRDEVMLSANYQMLAAHLIEERRANRARRNRDRIAFVVLAMLALVVLASAIQQQSRTRNIAQVAHSAREAKTAADDAKSAARDAKTASRASRSEVEQALRQAASSGVDVAAVNKAVKDELPALVAGQEQIIAALCDANPAIRLNCQPVAPPGG